MTYKTITRPTTLLIITAAAMMMTISGCDLWSDAINKMLPSANRPTEITFASETVTPQEYDQIAAALKAEYKQDFPHIQAFRDSGIFVYEGPKTCLRCHEQLEYTDAATGEKKTVDLMDNVVTSAHYRFYTKEHPNVYGFNGELADDFRMGKINRPCPKPGSFAMTAWAAPVVL
jgi:hypothetical protein